MGKDSGEAVIGVMTYEYGFVVLWQPTRSVPVFGFIYGEQTAIAAMVGYTELRGELLCLRCKHEEF